MKVSVLAALVLAVAVSLGRVAAAVAIHPSCPTGSYQNGSPPTKPDETGSIPIPTCTSFATHVAPSSGVVIPRYATYLDAHVVERLTIGVGSLVLGVLLVALAMVQRHRTEEDLTGSAKSV